MDSNEIITLVIDIVIPLISSFLGAFLGYQFSLKQRFSEHKKEVYYKLLEYLPINIPISQGDISQEYLSMGSPETSIRILQIRIDDYEQQLKHYAPTSEERELLKTEVSNSRYAINQLEQYMKVFNKIMQDLSEFKHLHYFNLFKIHANYDVRKAYAQFSVAISNDYHSSINVPSKVLNSLFDELLFTIKCDIHK